MIRNINHRKSLNYTMATYKITAQLSLFKIGLIFSSIKKMEPQTTGL